MTREKSSLMINPLILPATSRVLFYLVADLFHLHFLPGPPQPGRGICRRTDGRFGVDHLGARL